MSSRLFIKLVDLLCNPAIRVELFTQEMNDGEDNSDGVNTKNHIANVNFAGDYWYFDFRSYDGVVILERDFGLGNPYNKDLLGHLYAYGISYTVHH